MKHVLVCACVLATLVLAPAASAQTVNLTANLQGGNETPGLLTGMVGTAEVSVDVANRELAVVLRVSNAPTPTTAGHIHVGSAGLAGPVVLNFPNIPGRTGDFTLSFRLNETAFVARPAQGINTMDDIIQAIVAGGAYVNIHTQQNPGGEIRGQLTTAP
jgi:hypothetical protein